MDDAIAWADGEDDRAGSGAKEAQVAGNDSNWRRSVDRRLGGLERDVGTLKTDVAVLKADVSWLKEEVRALKAAVQELREAVRELRSESKWMRRIIAAIFTLQVATTVAFMRMLFDILQAVRA